MLYSFSMGRICQWSFIPVACMGLQPIYGITAINGIAPAFVLFYQCLFRSSDCHVVIRGTTMANLGLSVPKVASLCHQSPQAASKVCCIAMAMKSNSQMKTMKGATMKPMKAIKLKAMKAMKLKAEACHQEPEDCHEEQNHGPWPIHPGSCLPNQQLPMGVAPQDLGPTQVCHVWQAMGAHGDGQGDPSKDVAAIHEGQLKPLTKWWPTETQPLPPWPAWPIPARRKNDVPPWLCCQLVSLYCITATMALHPPVSCSHSIALQRCLFHSEVCLWNDSHLHSSFHILVSSIAATHFLCVWPLCCHFVALHLPFCGISFSLFPTCWPGPLVMLCMGSCLDHQGTSSPLSTSELTSHAKVGHRWPLPHRATQPKIHGHRLQWPICLPVSWMNEVSDGFM